MKVKFGMMIGSVLMVLMVLAGAASGEVRTWTDTTGKFKFEAEFVALEDGEVTLTSRTTGKTKKIPLDKLSEGDRKVAKELAAMVQGDDNTDYESLETTGGKVYKSVIVKEVSASQVRISHKSGVTTIPLASLPKEIQDELGYDPVKAKESERIADEATRERRMQAWLRLPVSKRYSILPKLADKISLRYQDYHLLERKAREKAINERSSKEKLAENIKHIPRGGYIIVHVERGTIGAANLAYFLVIVTDAKGREIARRQGERETPERDHDGAWLLIEELEPIDRVMPDVIDLRLRILTCTCRWELGDDLASVLRFAVDEEDEDYRNRYSITCAEFYHARARALVADGDIAGAKERVR